MTRLRSWQHTALRQQQLPTSSSGSATAKSKRSSVSDMTLFLLFYRLIVHPIFREPVRTALTVLAIALGVAVVLAIELAGNAAAGSFRSSMETLSGDNDIEITATGGVSESVVGTLTSLPYNLRISPRIEGYAFLLSAEQTLPLIGLDLIGEADRISGAQSDESPNAPSEQK